MTAHDRLLELNDKIAEWEANDVFHGDRGYQDMLEQRSELKKECEKEREEAWKYLEKLVDKKVKFT